MNTIKSVEQVKQIGTAVALFLHPAFAGFAFAVYPNLTSLSLQQDIPGRIVEFHGNQLLHFGHFLMVVAVSLLIIVAIHFMNLLRSKNVWLGFIGGMLAVTGAVILAVDKGALCLVPSAFDTLSEADFRSLTPGIEVMFQNKGWLWLLWLLPLLPIGFVIKSVGLVRSNVISRRYSIPILIRSILMVNPDIDLIGLVATIVLGTGFIPYAVRLIQISPKTAIPSSHHLAARDQRS